MIPKQVKIAGIEYDVEEIEGINDRFNTLGQINYHKGLIELDSELSQSRKKQTFVHEILHGCFLEAGYDEQERLR